MSLKETTVRLNLQVRCILCLSALSVAQVSAQQTHLVHRPRQRVNETRCHSTMASASDSETQTLRCTIIENFGQKRKIVFLSVSGAMESNFTNSFVGLSPLSTKAQDPIRHQLYYVLMTREGSPRLNSNVQFGRLVALLQPLGWLSSPFKSVNMYSLMKETGLIIRLRKLLMRLS